MVFAATRSIRGLFGPVMLFALVGTLGNPASHAWAKKPDKETPNSSAAIDIVDPSLPHDLAAASLEVNALDTFYQLDLSADQLKVVIASAAPEAAPRTPAKSDKKLGKLLEKLQQALLAGEDDAGIAGLRNQLIEYVNSNDLGLDDAIRPTPAARIAAKTFCSQLKASQIAAYIAMHADEVSDPVELFNRGVDTLRSAKSDSDLAGQTAQVQQETAAQIARLVAGSNDTKAEQVEQQVLALLKNATGWSDSEFDQQRPALEENVRRIVAEVGPVEVLRNWIEQQLAVLLSNPEASHAARVMLANGKAK